MGQAYSMLSSLTHQSMYLSGESPDFTAWIKQSSPPSFFLCSSSHVQNGEHDFASKDYQSSVLHTFLPLYVASFARSLDGWEQFLYNIV